MKKICFVLILTLCTVICGCGGNEGYIPPTEEVWPSHSPEATPYIHLYEPPVPETEEIPPEETYSSFEELLESLYSRVGNFFVKDWELEMFRGLPQSEPYSFVVHMEQPIGTYTEDTAIATAEYFTALGCNVRVKRQETTSDGMRSLAYVVILDITPEKLWELSTKTDDYFHVEQLYKSVDERFDILLWPAEGGGAA